MIIRLANSPILQVEFERVVNLQHSTKTSIILSQVLSFHSQIVGHNVKPPVRPMQSAHLNHSNGLLNSEATTSKHLLIKANC